MTSFRRITCLKPQASDNANRITLEWIGPDEVFRSYSVNQRTLNRYATAEELKAALDDWTSKNFGYILTDVYFHMNRDGSWAVATGQAPTVWPEDIVEEQ